MKKNYRMIVQLMSGVVFVAALLGACKLGQKDPTPTPTPTPTPPEMDTLSFMVRAITESKNLSGFSTFKNGLKLPVSVPKGQTVASKQTIINAIKVKAPELQAVALELYRGSNKTSKIYDENDPDLKNNGTVYVGKANYSNTVSITVKSVGATGSLYLPVAAYSGEGKVVSATVADTATPSAIAIALRGAIQRDTGSSTFDVYYKLFSDEAANTEAPDSLFIDGSTVYIGKKQNTAKVTVKTIAPATSITLSGISYFPVNAYVVDGKVLTATLPDNADSAAAAAALRQAIKADVGAHFDSLYKILKTITGPEATDADLVDGCTVYIVKKARMITVSFVSITNPYAPGPAITYPGPPPVNVMPVTTTPFTAPKLEITVPVLEDASAHQMAQEVKQRLTNVVGGATAYATYHFYRDPVPTLTNAITPDQNPTDFIDGCTVYVGKH